jgi:hypothetical protein
VAHSTGESNNGALEEVVGRRTLQETESCGFCRADPERVEGDTRYWRYAFGPVVGEDCAASGRARSGFYLQPWLHEQSIERAPRRSAVRAAALRSKIDGEKGAGHSGFDGRPRYQLPFG